MSSEWQYYHQQNPYYYNPHTHPNLFNQNYRPDNTKKANTKDREPEEMKPTDPPSFADVIEKLYKKLDKIEKENQELKDKVENIQPVTIENINYKIQDLSVQELSGTLLVGLTSLADAEELKKLLSDNGSVTFNDIDTGDMETTLEDAEVSPKDEKTGMM